MNIVIHDLSSEQFEQLCSHRTEHTKEMERISLEQLAKKAEVSQPTVLRMLNTFGAMGPGMTKEQLLELNGKLNQIQKV